MYEYEVHQRDQWPYNDPEKFQEYFNNMAEKGWRLVMTSDWWGTATWEREKREDPKG